jgi:3-oxoacyl-[acyl-carrier protein] reductase
MASMPRSVVVTGAADGIGRGIATRFAQLGDRVALLDYDAVKLARATSELVAQGGQVIGIPTDVRSASAVDAAIAQAGQTQRRSGRRRE